MQMQELKGKLEKYMEENKEEISKFKAEYVGTNFWGSMDAHWVAFYLFGQEIGVEYGHENLENLKLWEEIVKSVGWFWTFENICFVSDRPESISKENGILHNERGPAIRYRDGYEVYAMRGVNLEKYVVMNPEKITINDIQEETNLEVQRIKIEQYGAGKYLEDIGAEIIAMDTANIEGSSTRSLLRDSLGNKWFVGTDGTTDRVYYMACSESVTTCREAHEELFGYDETMLIAEA